MVREHLSENTASRVPDCTPSQQCKIGNLFHSTVAYAKLSTTLTQYATQVKYTQSTAFALCMLITLTNIVLATAIFYARLPFTFGANAVSTDTIT